MSYEANLVVMPSNHSGFALGRLFGKYPGRLGWLISPGGWRKPPSWLPYALDNGAYSAWLNKQEWDEHAFVRLLERAAKAHTPLWCVVPDVVADKDGTISKWREWLPILDILLPGVPRAFAVQDGMEPSDVPQNADIVFVGGTFEWKWRTVRLWTESFPRVHVARVNTERKLWEVDVAGAESCDGTGWFRGGEERLAELEHYLEVSENLKTKKTTLYESV